MNPFPVTVPPCTLHVAAGVAVGPVAAWAAGMEQTTDPADITAVTAAARIPFAMEFPPPGSLKVFRLLRTVDDATHSDARLACRLSQLESQVGEYSITSAVTGNTHT
ncbi:hypothetical protein [Streptomyces adustus]